MEFEQKTLAKERQKLGATLASLEGEQGFSGRELHAIWEGRARPFWRAQPTLYRALAARCHRAGENFLAIEAAEEGLSWYSDDLPRAEYLELVYLCALAYASVGAPDHAQELIRGLGPSREESGESLDLLAQTHLHWAAEADDETSAREHLELAYAAHCRALARDETPRRAITAAGTALRLGPGRLDQARALARRAGELCREEQDRAAVAQRAWADFEWAAARAQAALILGDFAAARTEYAEAAGLARHRRADLLALCKGARLLLGTLGHDPHEFDACFPLPGVGLFAGHMIDLPDRGYTRFSEERVAAVQARINAVLAEHNILIGYGSAACGADLLFLHGVLERPGGEVHVVLPFERERFWSESVMRTPGHEAWGRVFERVLGAAASVTELADSPCWFEGNALAFGNRVLHGLAERRAREFGDPLLTFAIWDGQPQGERPGGTAESVRRWAALGRTRVLIPPDGAPARIETHREPPVEVRVLPVGGSGPEGLGEPDSAVREEIYAILSGEWDSPPEIVRAGERPTLEATQAFFRRVTAALAEHGESVVHRWVDGSRFRLLFDDLAAAGHAALALRDRTAGEGRLRLGLHAGPVARWPHPLLEEREEPAGVHLQKAARLAALPLGARINVSREYAALLAAAPPDAASRRLHCVYQGSSPLGERFGRQELYALTG